MKAIKQISFKLIVILCIISTFLCFIASVPVYAAGSKVKTKEFYYSGTSKGSYTVSKSLWERIIEALSAILDYILGLMTMGIRIVFVGWTALLEQALTWILEGATGEEINVDGVTPVGLINSDDYITVEAIVFNHVPLFNINVFDFDMLQKYGSLGEEKEDTDPTAETKMPDDSLVMIIKNTIAGWYYTFRLISIMLMLIVLIYVGLKLAIATTGQGKAFYKKVLMDWLAGMIIVFFMHYIILGIIYFNELLVDQIGNMKNGNKELQAYEYGIEEKATEGATNSEMEISIYDEVRTRAYDAKLTVGFTGMIMYMVLVYYAWKFSLIYLKRYLVVAVCIMMAPIVAATYAYNKVKSGKAVIFLNWFKELTFMIILQTVHALVYLIFFQQALEISLASIGGMILAFVMLHFMTQAEEIFRKIFNIQGNLTKEVSGSKLKDISKAVTNASLGIAGSKAAIGMTKASARVLTKPFRSAADAGLGKIMEHRAKSQDDLHKRNRDRAERNSRVRERNVGVEERNAARIARNDERIARNEKRVRTGSKEPLEKLEQLEIPETVFEEMELTAKERFEARRMTRNNQLRLGELAKNLPKDRKNLTEEQKEQLKALKKAIPMQSLINSGQEMDEEEYIGNFYNNKDKYAEQFDKITTRRAVFKHEVASRWHTIMDPYQYVQKDPKTGKYKRVKEREHENWGPVLKYLSKKKSGVGETISSQYLNTGFLLGLTKAEKAALKKQRDVIKNEIIGFSGILIGLPLVVAEPAVGMVFLSKGISSSSKVFGSTGRIKRKNLDNMYMTDDGKYHIDYSKEKNRRYHFAGFNGKAVETIADGMQASARESVEDIEKAKRKHNRKVIKRTKKHTNVYNTIISGADLGAVAGTVTAVAVLNPINAVVAAPLVVGSVARLGVGAKLTGHLMGNFGDNAYMAFQESLRVSRKENAKKFKEELESTDSMLNYLADRYYEVEEQKQELKIESDILLFEASYRKARDKRIEKVEEMTDNRLLLENDYEEEIEIQELPNKTKKLTGASEKKLIDKAIVEIIQKSGIINIGDCNLNEANRVEGVKDSITKKLVEVGIISEGQKADVVIQDLDKKILAQKAILDKENPTAVQDKIVNDSILELMKEKGVYNPDSISDTEVTRRAEEKYQSMINGPTKQTTSVVNDMKKQNTSEPIQARGSVTPTQRANEPIQTSESVNQTQRADETIQTEEIEPVIFEITREDINRGRKSISDKSSDAKKKLDEPTRRKIKDKIAKKKIDEMNAELVVNQVKINGNQETQKKKNSDEITPKESKETTAEITQEIAQALQQVQDSGNIQSSSNKSTSNDIVAMLELQTRIHESKVKKELATISIQKPEKEKRKSYKMELFNQDGSVDLNVYSQSINDFDISRDGSKRVRSSDTEDGSRRVRASDVEEDLRAISGSNTEEDSRRVRVSNTNDGSRRVGASNVKDNSRRIGNNSQQMQYSNGDKDPIIDIINRINRENK